MLAMQLLAPAGTIRVAAKWRNCISHGGPHEESYETQMQEINSSEKDLFAKPLATASLPVIDSPVSIISIAFLIPKSHGKN